jgi:hypothetical protein
VSIGVDRILDRVRSTPDPIRGLKFSVGAVLEDGLSPRSYTWRCDFVLDQGVEGACVGHGFTHEMIARPVIVNKWPRPNFGAGNAQAFAFELYEWCRRNDEFPGEDYSGTSVAAGAKGMELAGALDEYRWTSDVDEMAVAVSHKGPVVAGINWYTGMFNPDTSNFLHKTGQLEGGHCLLINGYSLRKQAFRIHQSWGQDWGDFGEAWIDHDDMGALLEEDGEVCLPIRRHL